MSDKSKGGSATMLDLLGDAPMPTKPARAPKAPAKPAPPVAASDALFGAGDVDDTARHPANVPVAGLPAPSSLVAPPVHDEEEDPFADSVMAQALADEPAPLLSPAAGCS